MLGFRMIYVLNFRVFVLGSRVVLCLACSESSVTLPGAALRSLLQEGRV